MTMRQRVSAAILLFLLVGSVLATAEPTQGSPKEVLRKARERALQPEPLGSMNLRYALRFPDGRTGSFVWRQRGAEDLRMDIQVGQTTAARGVLAGKSWKSAGEQAEESWWLISTALDIHSALEFEEGDALRARSRRISGEAFLEIRSEDRRERHQRAVLLASPGLEVVVSEWTGKRLAYGGWRILPGVGAVPGACKLFLEGRLALELNLQAGTNEPPEDAELAVPQGALDWAYCAGQDDPEPVSQPSPTYPESARLDRAEGSVVLCAVIDTDGSVSGVHPIRTTSTREGSRELLAHAAEIAVKRWRYSPPQCKGKIAQRELHVTVAFRLR